MLPFLGPPFNCRLFGSSGACSACAQTIPANEFVMRTTSHLNGPSNTNTSNGNPQSIQHHVFHLKCFSCSKCGSHLVQGDRWDWFIEISRQLFDFFPFFLSTVSPKSFWNFLIWMGSKFYQFPGFFLFV